MFTPVWEPSFVAMSVALGASEAEVRAGMTEEAAARAPLLAQLVAPDKRTRAKALASGLAAIAFDLERSEVSWDP
jgi:hypothetical protein